MTDMTEMKNLFEQTAREIKERDDRLNVEVKTLADRLMQLEQSGGAGGAGIGVETKAALTLGDQVVAKLAEHGDTLARSKSVRFEKLEFKASGDVITTASGRNIVSGGVGSPSATTIGVQNAFNSRPAAGTSAIEYSRFLAVEGAAGLQVAEGDVKPAVRPTHSVIVQSALTIAGTTVLSRQSLSDSREMKQAIDVTLFREVNKALDLILNNGSAAPVWTGLLALATAAESAVYEAMPDAISEGVASMQTAGFAPDVVVMSPADWLAAVVARGTLNDAYLSGSYLAALPEAMRGLRVVLSPSVTAGKALVLDSGQLDLAICDGYTVELAYSGDDFVRNQIHAVGEMRVIPQFRSVGAALLVTPWDGV